MILTFSHYDIANLVEEAEGIESGSPLAFDIRCREGHIVFLIDIIDVCLIVCTE